MSDKLSPQPEATAEPPEKFPGGADSVEDEEKYGARPDEPTVPDLDPESNPAVDDEAPDEVKQPEDVDDEPTTDGASEPESEEPA